MALRPEGPGKDFNDMWNRHYDEALRKSARGEGIYAADASVRRVTAQPEQPTGGKHAKPNSDSCVVPLALLGGLAWALTEAAGKILS